MLTVKIPSVGESISEVTLIKWRKQNGEFVKRDEVIAELESEKATFELNADKAGILYHKTQEGTTILIGSEIAEIDEDAKQEDSLIANKVIDKQENINLEINNHIILNKKEEINLQKIEISKTTPVANIIIEKENVDINKITGTGNLGKIVKNDVLDSLKNNLNTNKNLQKNSRNIKREKLSQLRKVISKRLVEAKNTTAMLTTFNEVDMTEIMNIRTKYKEKFKKQHDVNLGFMSFFTKACSIALEEYPQVNAYIDGDEIQLHDFCDISIAVSAPKGLVVPIIRNAESLSFAEIEKKVLELATKAKENKLTIEEMTGGTFTITNGGVFGSLMSTPIINLPQSAILGMHKIQERPMAFNGQVLIRPMMYLALSYDHRIIDGKESVGFLVRVKELLEKPELLFTKKDIINYLLEI